MYRGTTQSVLQTHEKRKSDRKNWDRIFDEIAYYVLPSQTGFLTTFVPGERTRWSWRYDSTAVQANKTLANHLHMALVSPSQPWFEIRMKDAELDKIDAVREWAEDTTEKMYSAFNESNFNGQINTAFQSLCAFGTACLDVNFEANPFRLTFMGVKLSTCTFDVDGSYQIDTKVQEYEFSAKQMVELFGTDLETSRKKIKVLKITRPNPDYEEGSLSPKKRKYLVEWTHNKEIFKSDSAYEMPFMAFRFDQIDQDEIYGEGPALVCLSDIRTINRAKRLEMRGYEKAIDPPLIGTANGIIGDLHINAGGYTQVRNPRDIGELPGRMDINSVMVKGEELRDSIRATYKIDELLVPERKGQNPATATEIQVRYEQSQKLLGATVGRIQDELLKPMIERVFGIMSRNGRLMAPPEEIAGGDVEIMFVGPLAKSQTAGDAVSIERALQTSTAIAQIRGGVSKVIDFDKAERLLYDRYSVPASVLRSEDEVNALNQQERQAQQEQQQQQQQMGQAQVQEQQANADSAQVELLSNVRGM